MVGKVAYWSLGRRALPACARAVQIRLQSGASLFYTTRVFPTADVGTDAGWRYRYPVHEARRLPVQNPA